MQIKTLTQQAINGLNNDEALLEVNALLQHILNVNRAWLITHADDEIREEDYQTFQALLKRRLDGEPIAYILGEREFYGLPLKVTPDTLIPRPDTETLVEVALGKLSTLTPALSLTERELSGNDGIKVLDLGTGTGAIALAIAKNNPNTHVTAVDFSAGALAVAKENTENLNIKNVQFLQSNWFEALTNQRFDIIVSNPPYIEDEDPHLSQGDLRFEPRTALASGADGLDDIRHIINRAKGHLSASGYLLFEHGYNQADAVAGLLKDAGFANIETIQDLGGNDRVTLGQLN